MYKILAFSDIHANEEALDALRRLSAKENFDAIICAGDLTNRGPVSYARELLELFEKKFYFVHGNMDSQNVVDELRNHKGFIHGKKLPFFDWNIVGLGGSNPTPFATPSEYSESQIEYILQTAEADYNSIVVSHPPPKNYFDLVGESNHVGSSSVLAFMEKVKPLMLICGHIHEHAGKKIVGDTLIVKLPAAEALQAAKILIGTSIKVEFFSL
ncbi:MAG: metallophosphoesterase [Candidatus Anstonellaceae archaeon]